MTDKPYELKAIKGFGAYANDTGSLLRAIATHIEEIEQTSDYVTLEAISLRYDDVEVYASYLLGIL